MDQILKMIEFGCQTTNAKDKMRKYEQGKWPTTSYTKQEYKGLEYLIKLFKILSI